MHAPPRPPDAVRPARVRRLRTPLARAVVPVLGGLAVLGLIFLATWGMAVLISRGDADSSERLAPTQFEMGSVERWATEVVENGPIVLPDLDTRSGERTIVVDHTSDDPTRGWKVYWGYPAGRDATCAVVQVRGTTEFDDCDGQRIDVTQLAPAAGVLPVVVDDERLVIDLRALEEGPTTTTT